MWGGIEICDRSLGFDLVFKCMTFKTGFNVFFARKMTRMILLRIVILRFGKMRTITI